MMGLVSTSTWLLAVGCGVMAGVYFTFSGFVMASLGALTKPAGIAAMQSINRVILTSPFMPLFFGTSLLSLAMVAVGLWRWGAPGSPALLLGGSVYVAGMFACTAAFNVPLNEALDAVDPTSAEGARVWGDYLRRWTRWNHVRTLCSLAASGSFLWAARVVGL